MRLLEWLIAGFYSSFPLSAVASDQAQQLYTAKWEITDNDRLIGKPIIHLKSGQNSSIKVEGREGYELNMKVDPYEIVNGSIKISATILPVFNGSADKSDITVIAKVGQVSKVVLDRPGGKMSLSVEVSKYSQQ